ncbi:hypothetical protein [Azospirillum picis]|uniref:Uncharacterized protein n=1 Tax=Azospirillum picis TaxID=488438 RepID=A0ABU0MHV3_9PROT|nr:hypothetical protein [Azospirillum picis]MBP2299325.1 hypothetical protein [Azospirillum picis]MDQ0533037.1 hypothetical protein [Azospirillum picis]
MDRKPDETTLTARLPNLEISIHHRDSPEDGAELVAIQIRATPSFDAVAGLLGSAVFNPLLLAGPAAALRGPAAETADRMAGPDAAAMAELWLAPMRMWGDLVRQAWQPWLSAPWMTGPRRPGR